MRAWSNKAHERWAEKMIAVPYSMIAPALHGVLCTVVKLNSLTQTDIYTTPNHQLQRTIAVEPVVISINLQFTVSHSY